MNNSEDAIIEYDKAIELNSTDKYSYLMKNYALLDLGLDQEIADNFDRLIRLYPNDTNLYNEKGLFLDDFAQNYTLALNAYDDALAIWPNNFTFNMGKAFVLEELNQTSQALNYYAKSIELNPNATAPYMWLGEALYNLGRYELAIKYYDKAIEVESKFAKEYSLIPSLLANRGLAFAQLQNYTESMKSFSKAIELNPDNGWIYADKSEALMILDRTTEAIEAENKFRSLLN
jgi:superkiller protein 3